MGVSSVWVELGRGSLVRADSITRVEASGECALSVKITGEREPRTLNVRLEDPYPASWNEQRIASFEELLSPVVLAHGLIDAMAAAAEDGGRFEVALRVETGHSAYGDGVGWRTRRAGSYSADNWRSGMSFWDFAFAEFDDEAAGEDPELDLSTVQPLEVWDPHRDFFGR